MVADTNPIHSLEFLLVSLRALLQHSREYSQLHTVPFVLFVQTENTAVNCESDIELLFPSTLHISTIECLISLSSHFTEIFIDCSSSFHAAHTTRRLQLHSTRHVFGNQVKWFSHQWRIENTFFGSNKRMRAEFKWSREKSMTKGKYPHLIT